MSETLLKVFERFCDELPDTVRDDLLFTMVMLSDEDLVVDELDDMTNEREPSSRRAPSSAV
jgi:hypothetical protein